MSLLNPLEPTFPLFVFDVESVGLHGEGFAVAYVVVDPVTGAVLEEFYAGCPSDAAHGVTTAGAVRDRAWLDKNCLPYLPPPTHNTPREIRDAFWSRLQAWKAVGADIFAECGWPVEARFLIDCVEDDPDERNWSGPFPLHEAASIQYGAFARKSADDRRPEELPRHNPICDARQTARILVDRLRLLASRKLACENVCAIADDLRGEDTTCIED